MINTGTLDMDWSQPVSSKLQNDGQSSSNVDWSQPVSSKLSGDISSDIDWSQPVSNKYGGSGQTSSSFDWSQPLSSTFSGFQHAKNQLDEIRLNDNLGNNSSNSGFDWGQPVSAVLGGTGLGDTSYKTEFNGISSADDDSLNSGSAVRNEKLHLSDSERPNEDPDGSKLGAAELLNNEPISQRLKFRACLKLVVEELCTLPHHCEIYNKNLRSTFTEWLKKELDLIHRICDYKQDGAKFESMGPLEVSTPTTLQTGTN